MARIRFETRLPPQTVIGRLRWRTATHWFGDFVADTRASGPDPQLEGVVADDGFVLRTRASYPPFRYAAVCRGEVRPTESGSTVEARVSFTLGTWLPLAISTLMTLVGTVMVLSAASTGSARDAVWVTLGLFVSGASVLGWLIRQYRMESALIVYMLQDAAGLELS